MPMHRSECKATWLVGTIIHHLTVLAADVEILGCRKCHSNIPAVTDTFNESTLLLMEGCDSSESEDSAVVAAVDGDENAGGIRTYSVHDFATSARSP